MNPEKLELSELVDKFLVHKRSEGWSERTVEWYQQALALFQAWLAEQGMSTRLDDLGEDEMRPFILHLKGQARSARSCLQPHRQQPSPGRSGVLQLAVREGLHRVPPA